ncbi:MAG: hypothetical protein COA49_08700 [Bacteroidetes bacterium]|nr:MAG: hypothetical protein COA49_08700 [Bacteroidota bacterium]
MIKLSPTKLIFLVTIIVLTASCASNPQNNGYVMEERENVPETISGELSSPDYSLKKNWALDGADGGSRELPKRYHLEESSANGADVFYIHPTMYNSGGPWIASIDDQELNTAIDYWPIRHQASVFNGVGRVFAPRYRQAHYRVFKIKDELGVEALDIAYSDVRKAFLFWLENFDTGRPIIIAGHSQGTWHARLLLQEFFDGTELEERLVVAYLPGFGIYANDFKSLKPCQTSDDTGCYCAWMTYATGYTPEWLTKQEKIPVCINPISWDTKTESSDAAEHLGVVTEDYKFKYKGILTAKVHQGILWLDEPDVIGGRHFQQNNWHVGDYNLFWANIRKNASDRLSEFEENSVESTN